MEIKIDKLGDWFINTGAFRLADPTNNQIYESGVKYKVLPNDWILGQPTMKLVEEDTDPEEVEVQQPFKPGDRTLKLESPAEETKPETKKK